MNQDRYASVTEMLNELDLLTVKQRVIYNTMKLIYKAEQKRLPRYLCDMFIYVSDVQPYNLRNNSEFRLPQYMSSFGQNSIMFKGLQKYNNFKSKYEITQNISEFKNNLMEFVKTNL